jgi:predicted peptidase
MRNAANGRLPNDPTLPSRSFPGFVLFPQNINGWTTVSVQDAIKLVRLIAKKYNIDENRIYVEGLSNGGYAVYETIKRASWLFSAAFAMSAVSDAGVTYYHLEPTIADIPMWIFQGGQDTNESGRRRRQVFTI